MEMPIIATGLQEQWYLFGRFADTSVKLCVSVNGYVIVCPLLW